MITLMIQTLENETDREFMTWLYQEYRLLMYSVASSCYAKQEDRDDLVQASMERLLTRVEKLRSLSCCALPSYLVITIRNTFYTQYRRDEKRAARCVSLDETYAADTMFVEDFAATVIEDEYNKEVLLHMWDHLPEEERFLLEGKYVLEMSDEELARTVGGKPSSIRMKLTRARRNAAKRMKELTEAGVI